MKRLLLLILLSASFIALKAQNADSLIYKQLNRAGYRAQQMAGTGATLALVGVLTMTAGVLIDKNHTEVVGEMVGPVVAEVGVCLFAVGVPLWIIEVSKMNTIEIEMIKFEGYSQGGGVGVKIKF